MFKVKLLVQVPSLMTFTLTVITKGVLVAILLTSQISLFPFWIKLTTFPPTILYLPAYSRPSGKLSIKPTPLVILTSPVFVMVKLYCMVSPTTGFLLFTSFLESTVVMLTVELRSNNSKSLDQVPSLLTSTLTVITATSLALIFLISKITFLSSEVVLTSSAPEIESTSTNVNPSDK